MEHTESRATVEYVEGENAVRYLARQGGGAGEYETTPWEQWARTQCVSAARDPAMDSVSEELGISVGGSVHATSVSVAIETVVEGNRVVREPGVEFEDLVAATPRTVRVTYTLDSETYTDDVDVYAEHRVITRL
ncbi:hypothetical protein [Halobaculum lipolyticum]|uniref:Halobacterial output domain-containing protein n=1 Tax=Halobaculum lipolyticum TaxID=3032001 RepID=A0ABD5W8K8_9EURY|nr:hypothetical protein [Halobaculum sp. DT31]